MRLDASQSQESKFSLIVQFTVSVLLQLKFEDWTKLELVYIYVFAACRLILKYQDLHIS